MLVRRSGRTLVLSRIRRIEIPSEEEGDDRASNYDTDYSSKRDPKEERSRPRPINLAREDTRKE